MHLSYKEQHEESLLLLYQPVYKFECGWHGAG